MGTAGELLMISHHLVRAFDFPALAAPPDYPDAPAVCGICGQSISEGYRTKALIKQTTAEIADIFRGHAWVCRDCARVFGDSRFTGNFISVDGAGVRPMVALSSVTAERPAWRELLRQIPHNVLTVTVVTSNTKRRLWVRAVVSAFGAHWQPFFVDGAVERLLTIDIERLRECLDLVEGIYELGYSKATMALNLLDNLKLSVAVGLPTASALEVALQAWRGTDELILSLFVAQKEAKEAV